MPCSLRNMRHGVHNPNLRSARLPERCKLRLEPSQGRKAPPDVRSVPYGFGVNIPASATGPKDLVASWTPLSLYYT